MGRLTRWVCAGLVGWAAMATAALLMAGPVSARTCTKQVAPPGHAGSTQYYETIPTSCGNATPSNGGTSGSTGSPINRLGHGRAGVKSLSRLGAQGAAAAALAAADAPVPAGDSASAPAGDNAAAGSGPAGRSGSLAKGRTGSPSSHRQLAVPPTSGSAGSALTSALAGSGSGGLGLLLPVLLGLSLLGAVAAGVFRARRPGGPSV